MKKMQRLAMIILSLSAASLVWAQTVGEEPEAGEDAETQIEAQTEASSEDIATDDIDVDDGSYIDAEDDDFRPSEEISSDQSIDFPTDI